MDVRRYEIVKEAVRKLKLARRLLVMTCSGEQFLKIILGLMNFPIRKLEWLD